MILIESTARYGENAALLLGCLRAEQRVQCLRERSVLAIQSVELPEVGDIKYITILSAWEGFSYSVNTNRGLSEGSREFF